MESSSYVLGLKRAFCGEAGVRMAGTDQERRLVGEMDFFETKMRKEKRERKEAAAATDHDAGADAPVDLSIKKGDLTMNVSIIGELVD